MTANNQLTVELSTFVEKNYEDYGRFVNFSRVLCSIDGLKPSLRRILLTMHEEAVGKKLATSSAIALTQHKYHPFGDQSIEDVLVGAVRDGLIEPHGEFGVKLLEEIKHSAPRYTKVLLDRQIDKALFTLLRYAPMTEGEHRMEPEHLITPVPLVLMTSTMSWGLGIVSRTPGFTYDSLLAAYEADDASLLQSSYGYKIVHNRSNLEGIFRQGKGNLTLSMNVRRDGEDIIIFGSGALFTPRLKLLDKWVNDNQIFIVNESTEYVSVRVSRIKGARKVNMDELEQFIRSTVAVNSKHYDIRIVYQGVITSMSVKDWLFISMTHFCNTYERYKQDRIAALEYQILLLTNLPAIGKAIIDGKSNSEIAEMLKIDEKVVVDASRKSISMLRRESFQGEIENAEKSINEIRAEEPRKLIREYGSVMNKIAASPF